MINEMNIFNIFDAGSEIEISLGLGLIFHNISSSPPSHIIEDEVLGCNS